MAEDLIRYDILTQEALRGVVRKVLAEVARAGLPGEHHFFITFYTRAPGVRISQKLLDQYDKEMTIVLQNQFWGLKVNETNFEVGLSFGQPETLVIPFAALRGFFDPSVQTGMQFQDLGELEELGGEVPDAAEMAEAAESGSTDDEPEGEPGEKVVSLDSFRKKP
ncbi:hypothetical protein GCM10007989_08210 [Devosia pacifica]|uniref:Stringent starvation protein B n=1 Tax=Devosia pacifica TaxID=1335967 RepID=A0A918VQW5_9HYPH|nr:ClpXP protease specificity-enhancing factor SspB [Devosia pacifica]GHA15765.1 hypothetical protein GCM10007989_08210 [Devosia pacifica]